MARRARNASQEGIVRTTRTFFVTTNSHAGRRLLQSQRNAELLIDVLRAYVSARKFQLLDFVIMPDHIHLFISVQSDMTIEKAMQLIKGRFSFLLKKEHGYLGEVWQHGFSETRADNGESQRRYRDYIEQNPVKAGLCSSPGLYPYCYLFLAKKKEVRG
jgi:putative transposase